MLTDKFRKALEEYHRKKWFPEKYPDPFGEFIDYISEGMINDLLESWKEKKKGPLLDAAHYLLRILPQIGFSEIFYDYRKALSERLTNDILPEFAFFYLRTLPNEESSDLWTSFRHWNDKWETVLSEWCRALMQFEEEHSELLKGFQERLRIDAPIELSEMEKYLRDTSELFAWQIQNQTHAKTLPELLRYFRFHQWDKTADWNHFSALAKSVSEAFGISKIPKLRSSSNSAAQFLFPITPPNRVTLEFGSAHGPVDALRFLQEFGKGVFYSGMNPDLEIEERICGDPALPWFWGSIFASILTDSAGVKNFIGLGAEGLERDMEFVMEFWQRQEMTFSIFRNKAASDWKNLQDHFASLWEIAFSMDPPRFLCLYDLSRSNESIYKALAMSRSRDAIHILRTKYGSKWFSAPKWTKRMRDYFWEGHRMTMSDVMKDL
jgi:hypothetical protein